MTQSTEQLLRLACIVILGWATLNVLSFIYAVLVAANTTGV